MAKPSTWLKPYVKIDDPKEGEIIHGERQSVPITLTAHEGKIFVLENGSSALYEREGFDRLVLRLQPVVYRAPEGDMRDRLDDARALRKALEHHRLRKLHAEEFKRVRKALLMEFFPNPFQSRFNIRTSQPKELATLFSGEFSVTYYDKEIVIELPWRGLPPCSVGRALAGTGESLLAKVFVECDYCWTDLGPLHFISKGMAYLGDDVTLYEENKRGELTIHDAVVHLAEPLFDHGMKDREYMEDHRNYLQRVHQLRFEAKVGDELDGVRKAIDFAMQKGISLHVKVSDLKGFRDYFRALPQDLDAENLCFRFL